MVRELGTYLLNSLKVHWFLIRSYMCIQNHRAPANIVCSLRHKPLSYPRARWIPDEDCVWKSLQLSIRSQIFLSRSGELLLN